MIYKFLAKLITRKSKRRYRLKLENVKELPAKAYRRVVLSDFWRKNKYAQRVVEFVRRLSHDYGPRPFFAGALLLVALTILVWRDVITEEKPAPVQMAQPERPLTFRDRERATGIVTFFHSAPYAGQLEVFSDWEGKYRIREQGNTVSFIFIGGKSGVEPELFSITHMMSGDWNPADKKDPNIELKEIGRRDDVVFVMKTSKTRPLKGEEAEAYRGIMNDLGEAVKSFKVLKMR